jgi:hypothetical protein
LPGRPGEGDGTCGGIPGSTGGVPGTVGSSPGRPVPGGITAPGGNGLVRPGKRLVNPATPPLVRKRFVPVNRFVRPRLVGGAGFVPTIGVCGKSGARSLNCPPNSACANAPAPASKLKSVSRVFITFNLSTGRTEWSVAKRERETTARAQLPFACCTERRSLTGSLQTKGGVHHAASKLSRCCFGIYFAGSTLICGAGCPGAG